MIRRNTPAKQKVHALLSESGSAMSQEMLEKRLRGEMDRVTIYRILAGFCADGLVHRVVADDGKAYYALCRNCKEGVHSHEHAHFRCTYCQKVECLPEPACPNLPAGYELHTLNYWISGTCSACKQIV